MDHTGHPERMDREARMERLGQGVWQARAVLEVSLVHVAHQGQLDSLVLLEWTALTVPKETWGHKESQDHPVSRVSPEHRVFLAHKAPSDHLVKKDPRAGQDWLAYLDLMGLQVILVKRVLPARKEP